MDEKKKDLNLFIPEDLAEYYITGGAIASSPFDVRLILFKDEIEKNDILLSSNVNMIKTAKTEIIMPFTVAKQLRDLISKELEKYEDT